jgi:chromosome segregation ATPase
LSPAEQYNKGTVRDAALFSGWNERLVRNDELSAIEDRFAELEKRVGELVTRHKLLKSRIKELEQELAQARREAQQVEHFHGKKLHIKEKIEKILNSLENTRDHQ